MFNREDYGVWFLALVVACGASLAWGLKKRQFAFVAYAAVYGYVGISSILVRNLNDDTALFGYFFLSGITMLTVMIRIARRFGREG